MLSRYPASPTPPFDEVNLSTAGSTGESTLRYTGIEPLCSLSGLEAVAVAIRLNSSPAVTLNTCRGSLMGSCRRTWQTSFTLSSARARVAGVSDRCRPRDPVLFTVVHHQMRSETPSGLRSALTPLVDVPRPYLPSLCQSVNRVKSEFTCPCFRSNAPAKSLLCRPYDIIPGFACH